MEGFRKGKITILIWGIFMYLDMLYCRNFVYHHFIIFFALKIEIHKIDILVFILVIWLRICESRNGEDLDVEGPMATTNTTA